MRKSTFYGIMFNIELSREIDRYYAAKLMAAGEGALFPETASPLPEGLVWRLS
jgi:hypothetical protein